MGNGTSAAYDDKATLNRALGICIRDVVRPSEELIAQAWNHHDSNGQGALTYEEALSVLRLLIDLQIKSAQEAANTRKMEVARQQAQMERKSRKTRSEVLNMAAEHVSTQTREIDAATALVMATRTSPVIAGMMAGYMDIAVTCLKALREDGELLEKRISQLFLSGSDCVGSDGRKFISRQKLISNYLGFFDQAPALLDGDSVAENSTSECSVQ